MTTVSSSRPRVIFCGSFLHYSALILEKMVIAQTIEVVGVVTTPPQPTGRQKILTPTPVQQLAERLNIPVWSPALLNQEILDEIGKKIGGQPDLLVTAGYGKLLPPLWLEFPTMAAVNLHFSLLPAYRGANPAEWALLRGEKETGVTLIEMSPRFDTGKMVAQCQIAITASDTRETLYEKLYSLGGDVLPRMLTEYVAFRRDSAAPSDAHTTLNSSSTLSPITYYLPPVEQTESPTPYAKRLTREDGFINWTAIKDVMAGDQTDVEDLSPQLGEIWRTTSAKLDAFFIERAIRALSGFPGIWTMVETSKGLRRLKLLTAHLEDTKLILDQVQLEGQAVADWNQVKTSVT